MGGCPGRAERRICVYLRSFAVEFRPENGALDRKWTQMDANEGLEGPKTEIFSRKTGKGHENRMGRGRKLRNLRKMGLKVLRNGSKRPENYEFCEWGVKTGRADARRARDGSRNSQERRFSAGKQERGRKTGWERGIHPVFLSISCFPASALWMSGPDSPATRGGGGLRGLWGRDASPRRPRSQKHRTPRRGVPT